MLGPNIEGVSPQLPTAHWLFAGHASASPEKVTKRFTGRLSAVDLSDDETDFSTILSGIDAAALVVSAKTGISKGMIAFWEYISERQFPRMVIVNGLEMSETDFDDIVMIANRVLEEVATPFLVLHDELGEPSGLIELSSLTVYDYSGNLLTQYPADEELVSLVAEFKAEVEEKFIEFGDSGFSEGLLVPALPLGEQRNFGVNEIQNYLNSIQGDNK